MSTRDRGESSNIALVAGTYGIDPFIIPLVLSDSWKDKASLLRSTARTAAARSEEESNTKLPPPALRENIAKVFALVSLSC